MVLFRIIGLRRSAEAAAIALLRLTKAALLRLRIPSWLLAVLMHVVCISLVRCPLRTGLLALVALLGPERKLLPASGTLVRVLLLIEKARLALEANLLVLIPWHHYLL